MRRRILLLPVSLILAAAVLLTPAGFVVQRWMAPAGESAFAYRHPVAMTALAALLPWMIAGAMTRRRFVMRLPLVFLLVGWSALAIPVMGITIFDEHPLHRDSPEIAEQMRTGRGMMRVPPRRAANAALARGDCRPLARLGFGPVTPGVDELPAPERAALQPYGYRAFPATSDVLVSPGHMRYGWRTGRYARRYNLHLLARLRAADGRLDLSRCTVADRSPLLP